MARIKLTKKLVAELSPPSSGQRFVWDAEIPGFGVRLTPSGGKSWIVQFRIRGGKERRLVIGRCDRVPLDQARVEARRTMAAADLGRDPGAERQDARKAQLVEKNPIFEDFATRWLEEVAARRNRTGTLKHRRLLLKNHIFPAIGRLRLADITRHDIEKLHRKIGDRFPVAANRAVSVCSAIFAAAVRWGLITANPALQIERNAEHHRENYLRPDEIRKLSIALDESPAQDSADVVRLLLLTGARVGEVLKMRWDQLDMDAGVWTKPAATTKQNKLHRSPLSLPAIQLLKKREARAKKSDWVFPGKAKQGHMTTIKTFWAAVTRRAKIKEIRVHDLRHTFASLLVSSGENLSVVGALLGHTQAKTTSRYAHLLDEALHKAAARVAEITGRGAL
ncbi:MAG TPA: tyrosine-type recombinase/integrase [Dongiaceae bacterium]|nr:tyrosine-type recombinase/integrase [Dongiaceae bacterium]